MENLAPDIFRQRFVIEGFVGISVDRDIIVKFFEEVTSGLSLRMYGEPIVFSPGGEGKEENQGFDAFVPLIDSGISLYFWSSARFLSVVIYTCKGFDEERALAITKKFFQIEKITTQSF